MGDAHRSMARIVAGTVAGVRQAAEARYQPLIDNTCWMLRDLDLRVTGGVLTEAQADHYVQAFRLQLGIEPPRPAVLSALDCDHRAQRWLLLADGDVVDLHRRPLGDDLQSQWTGPALLRSFAQDGARQLVQLPDGTLGWTGSTLSPLQEPPRADPWASIRRPRPNEAIGGGDLDRAATLARARLGCPYRWGGNREEAADCSGFVQGVIFGASGVLLPKHTGDQRRLGARIGKAAITAGNLIFVRGADRNIGHVGLVLAAEAGEALQVIHSCLSRGWVLEEGLAAFLDRYRFQAARRLLRWDSAP